MGVREWRDVTHAEIADEAETTAATVSRWEAGKARPSGVSLRVVASYLGTTKDWLESGTGAAPSAEAPAQPPGHEAPAPPTPQRPRKEVSRHKKAPLIPIRKPDRGTGRETA